MPPPTQCRSRGCANSRLECVGLRFEAVCFSPPKPFFLRAERGMAIWGYSRRALLPKGSLVRLKNALAHVPPARKGPEPLDATLRMRRWGVRVAGGGLEGSSVLPRKTSGLRRSRSRITDVSWPATSMGRRNPAPLVKSLPMVRTRQKRRWQLGVAHCGTSILDYFLLLVVKKNCSVFIFSS